ncbi:DUF11 domain-containing protein [Actinoplanes sp. TRM 88003]|uniref:DUF11 domain-containing protein n=1 Tax=Paractinoplanes aksuensis TaxID=2939490 RepID=A0ABT1DPN7_9ACTN|nr:DUF11 domain-containing protein [Actinoplanes aksuensis]MCO8272813.1 DUF11 domain-containing protein [Actinoplanes aksuensis]
MIGNNNYSVQSAGTSVADVGVALSLAANTAAPGDTVPFTLTVTNNGPSAATNVSFNTVVPPGFTIVRPSNPYCTPTACTLPSLPAGAVIKIQGDAVVGADAAAGVQQAGTTVISPTTDNQPANDTDTVTFTIVLNADLAVAQTLTNAGGGAVLVAGRPVRGTVTVTNAGPTRADGVALRQPVPAGRRIPVATASAGGSCAFQGAGSPGGTTPDGGLYLCTLASLARSATWTVTFGDALLPPDHAGASFARTASVSSSAPDPATADNSVTTTATVEHRADLKVTKTTSTPTVVQTDPVAFRVTVENLGPSDADTVVLHEEPSAGLILTAGTATSGSYDPGATTWRLGTLAAGATERLDLTGEADGPGALTNTTRILSSASIDPEPANDSDTATVTAAPAAPALDLEVTTTVAPGPASGAGAGDTITYAYRVTNTGNLPMTGLAVTGTRGGPGACGATSLAPGAATICPAGSYVVTSADVTAGQPIADVVTATAENAATTGPTQYAEETTAVPLALAWPSLVVLVAPVVSAPGRQNAAAVGDTIDYRYTVVNNGNVAMEFLTLTDTRGAGVSCPATVLAIGDSMTCTSASGYVVRQADLDAGGVVSDAATVTARPAGSPTPRSYGPFGADVKVAAPAPALSLRVTAAPAGPVVVGDRIAYRYEITNRGNVTVGHLAVTDEMITTVTCPATTLAVGATVVCTSAGDYEVTQDDLDAGVLIINDVLVEGQGVAPGSPLAKAEHSARVPVAAAVTALTVTITPSGPSGALTLGDRVTYAYAVRNTGNVTMSQVTVTDSRLGGATCPAATVAPATTMTCAGAAVYAVSQADVDTGGTIDSTARVLGRAPGEATARAYDTATASLALAPPAGRWC